MIPNLESLVSKNLLPMSITFTILTRDSIIYELLEVKGYIDVFYIRSYHNLRKKIRAPWYDRLIHNYNEILDYEIVDSVILEWLDLNKISDKHSEDYYELFNILKTLT